jgi:hypothetical protein
MAPKACSVSGFGTLDVKLKIADPKLRYRNDCGQPEFFFLLAGARGRELQGTWSPWETLLPLSFMDEVKNLPGVEVNLDNLNTDEFLEMTTPDGGLMRVHFRIPEGLESVRCLVTVTKLTDNMAGAIWTLLETGLSGSGLALMPPGLVTKMPPMNKEAKTFAVVDVQQLSKILKAGPMAWWTKEHQDWLVTETL